MFKKLIKYLYIRYCTKSQKGLRRSGRSTRLADAYIQVLFDTGYIKVCDHHSTQEANVYLFKTIINRYAREHTSVYNYSHIHRGSRTIRIPDDIFNQIKCNYGS